MALCSLGCGRVVKPNSQFAECAVCRGNIAGWTLRPRGELKNYVEKLEVRHRRMEEISAAGPNSYVTQLKAKRRRRA